MAEVLESGRRPTWRGSRYVLTEFSSVDPYSRVRGTLYGWLRPVIFRLSHSQNGIRLSFEYMENVADTTWKLLGAMIQINADSLVGEAALRQAVLQEVDEEKIWFNLLHRMPTI